MALEQRGFSVGHLVAAADLSAKQFCFVKIDASGLVAVCGNGELALGVLQNNPVAGEAADVMVEGVTKVVCSASLAAGAVVGSNASGLAEAPATGEYGLGVLAAAGTTTVYGTLVLKPCGKQ